MRTYNAKELSLKLHNDTICTSAKFHYLRLKNILRFRRWYSDHAWHVKMELEFSIYKDWNQFITFDISYNVLHIERWHKLLSRKVYTRWFIYQIWRNVININLILIKDTLSLKCMVFVWHQFWEKRQDTFFQNFAK